MQIEIKLLFFRCHKNFGCYIIIMETVKILQNMNPFKDKFRKVPNNCGISIVLYTYISVVAKI